MPTPKFPIDRMSRNDSLSSAPGQEREGDVTGRAWGAAEIRNKEERNCTERQQRCSTESNNLFQSDAPSKFPIDPYFSEFSTKCERSRFVGNTLEYRARIEDSFNHDGINPYTVSRGCGVDGLKILTFCELYLETAFRQ
jgi:hypothetical protein